MVTPNLNISNNEESPRIGSVPNKPRKLPSGNFDAVADSLKDTPEDEGEEPVLPLSPLALAGQTGPKKKSLPPNSPSADSSSGAALIAARSSFYETDEDDALGNIGLDEEDWQEAREKSTSPTVPQPPPPLLAPQQNISSVKTKSDKTSGTITPEVDTAVHAPKKSDTSRSIFEAIEQPDLSTAVPPLAPQSGFIRPIETFSVQAPVNPTPSVEQLINQFVQAIQQHELGGKTETVITLKAGPLGGARLILTELDTAPRQINITIDGLTQAGQLQVEANRGILVQNLQRHDLVVQLFTATTTQVPLASETTKGRGFSFDEKGSDSGSQQGREKNRG